MRHSTKSVLILALIAHGARAAGQVDSVSIEDAKGVLRQYAELSYLQHSRFVDLYSDRAVVRVRGQGEPAEQRFFGHVYKQQLRDRLQARDMTLDASQFKDVRLERYGKRLVIHANRYAANRCYYDPTYFIALEREGSRWRIVEEAITIQPKTQRVQAGKPATAVSKVPTHAQITNLRTVTNSPSPWAPALRDISSPSSLPPVPAANAPSSLETALLAQRAADARAIAQQMSASYGQLGTAAPKTNATLQAGGVVGAARPLDGMGVTASTSVSSSLWVTPD